MAKIVIPSEAEWAIIKRVVERLGGDDAVLVSPAAAKAIAAASGSSDTAALAEVEHDFDGAYDLRVDVCDLEHLSGLSGEELRASIEKAGADMRVEAVAKAFGIIPVLRLDP